MSSYGYHKNSALSERESIEFLGRINKRGERKCIGINCGKVFISQGYHNRKCPKCNTREKYAERTTKTRDPVVYRARSSGAISTAFYAEIGE